MMSNLNELKQLLKGAVAHLSEDELGAYHDNAVDEVDRACIEAHLGRCLICKRRLAMMREALAAYPQELITEEDTGRVKAFLLHDAIASLESIGRLDSAAVTAEIIPHLERLLQDESNHVRKAAVEAVGKIGSAAATDEILSLIDKFREEGELSTPAEGTLERLVNRVERVVEETVEKVKDVIIDLWSPSPEIAFAKGIKPKTGYLGPRSNEPTTDISDKFGLPTGFRSIPRAGGIWIECLWERPPHVVVTRSDGSTEEIYHTGLGPRDAKYWEWKISLSEKTAARFDEEQNTLFIWEVAQNEEPNR